jgi:hypothetical protein
VNVRKEERRLQHCSAKAQHDKAKVAKAIATRFMSVNRSMSFSKSLRILVNAPILSAGDFFKSPYLSNEAYLAIK